MGFRGEVLFWSLLLLWGGSLSSSASQNLNVSTSETQRPDQQEPDEVTVHHHESNEIEEVEVEEEPGPLPTPVTYKLKVYQLRENEPRVRPGPVGPVGPVEEGGLASDWVETVDNMQAQEKWTPMVQGPDLNPPYEKESKVKFEQRSPVPADSVTARCGERDVTVEVKQDFLGNGQMIRPGDVTLGGCPVLDAADHVLRFQAELHACSSTLTMTEDDLVYSFTLTYAPTPIGKTFILKSNRAQVVVQCHYRRRHHVSSGVLRPTWTQFSSSALAEKPLLFSLRLVTEDWQTPRPSSVFFLSDVMRVEASVLQGHHVPLRVYVDRCVATAYPDPESQPRYPFITNHGCLRDAKLTGAKSYFLQRSREDKLHFQLKAFRFHQDHRNSLYITCHLKATTVSAPIDPRHKACSFLTEAQRWVASGGDNKVCDCCESSCSDNSRGKRSLSGDTDVDWEGTAALGPIVLQEDSALQLMEAPPDPPLRQNPKVTEAVSSSSSLALLCGAGAAMALVLLLLTGVFIHSRLRKRAGHDVCT